MDEVRRINMKGFSGILQDGKNNSPFILEDYGKILNQEIHTLILNEAIFEATVVFKGIIFKDDVQFNNCKFNELEFNDVIFPKALSFISCICTKKIKFINCALDTLSFEQGEYDEISFRGTIKESVVGENKITFKNGKINKINFLAKEVNSSIDFKGGKIGDLYFLRTRIESSLIFNDDVSVGMITSESSDFQSRIDFHKSKFKTVYLSKSNLAESLVFSEDFQCQYLTLSGINSKRFISINYQKNNIESIDIGDLNAEGTCSITSDFKGQPKSEIGTCSLYLRGTFQGFLSIENISVYPDFSLINFGTILMDNVRTKIFNICNFHNYGKLTVSNLHPDEDYNCLIIYDSNLQATEFINVDFREFNEVVIAKSNVSGLLLSNSFFPARIQTESSTPQLGYKIESINKIKDDSYKRENYRQLKIAMEAQGNRKEALYYKSLEMHYLWKELRFGWDKILLFLNLISNSHGRSWIRGICFTVLSSFAFFICYENSIHSPSFYLTTDPELIDMESAFESGASNFLRYLASFPSLRFENEKEGSLTNLIVILSRIFIGYGIYQTIVAFRKFGAK